MQQHFSFQVPIKELPAKEIRAFLMRFKDEERGAVSLPQLALNLGLKPTVPTTKDEFITLWERLGLPDEVTIVAHGKNIGDANRYLLPGCESILKATCLAKMRQKKPNASYEDVRKWVIGLHRDLEQRKRFARDGYHWTIQWKKATELVIGFPPLFFEIKLSSLSQKEGEISA